MADTAVAAVNVQQQLAKPAAKVAKKVTPSVAASNAKVNRIGGVEMRVPDRMEVDMARQDVQHIEAKERAEREAQEARIKEALAQAEKARAEAQARAEVQAQAEAARAKALVEAEATQPAESSQKSNQTFPPEIGVDTDALQPPINGEGLGDLEGWDSSEGEEEYEEGQPGKEDDDEEDEDDNPDSLFAEEDGAENAYEGMNEGFTSTQNESADEDILHFNPRGSMSRV